ncbi:hypothetical protein AeNC1_004429 [Aphanomyces euteiches]|nr:hypothetical protein AeNC1_004429 [Aphanomyces euteiches]
MSDTIIAPGTFLQTWTSGNATLEGIDVQIPGRIIISYDQARNDTATVEITSTSEDLANVIDINTVPASTGLVVNGNGIQVLSDGQDLKLKLVEANVDVRGTLLVKVILNQPVARISSFSGELIVQDGALSLQDKTANVSVSSFAGKRIWIDSTSPVSVSSLSVNVGGSGDVYLTSPSVQAKNLLDFTVLGSGSLIVDAKDVATDLFKSTILGSGNVYTNASVIATRLESEILGSGSINYYPSGACNESKVSIIGSGSAYIGSVASNFTYVDTIGSGDAYIQAIDTLTSDGFGPGKVKYFNVTPVHAPKAPEKKHSWFSIPKPKVELTSENKHKEKSIVPEPPLSEGSTVHVVTHHGWFYWPPSNSQASVQNTNLLNSRLGSSPHSEYGISAIAMMFIAIVAFIVYKKNKRNGYQVIQ